MKPRIYFRRGAWWVSIAPDFESVYAGSLDHAMTLARNLKVEDLIGGPCDQRSAA